MSEEPGFDQDQDDHETLMDGCASECMEAIEAKDKPKFREAFGTLVADILNKMGMEHEE